MRPATSSRLSTFERQLHPPFAAKLVHQDAAARVSLYVLKQQRRPARDAALLPTWRLYR